MFDLIPKILALGVPRVTGLFRFRRSMQLRPRSNLKADCETLTMLRQVNVKSCSLVEARIDDQVARLYGDGKATTQGRFGQLWKNSTTVWRVSFGALVLCAGFAATAYLVRHHFTWWSLLTGYAAFAGAGLIMISFDASHELSRTYSELGEKVFDLFKDKKLDAEVDPLVERIKTLQQQIAEAKPAAPPHQAIAHPR